MVCDCGCPALQDGKHIGVLNYGVKGFLPWCISGRLIVIVIVDRLEVLNFTACDIMTGSQFGGPEL